MDSFNIGKLAVSPGEWIAWNDGLFLIQGKICDNKASPNGLQVYVCNEQFPKGHEGAFPIVNNCRRLTEVEVIALPRAVVAAADKFFADAKGFDFN